MGFGFLAGLLGGLIKKSGPAGQITGIMDNIPKFFNKIDYAHAGLKHRLDGVPVILVIPPSLTPQLSGAPALFSVQVQEQSGNHLTVAGACAIRIPGVGKTIMELHEWVQVNDSEKQRFPNGNVSFSFKPSQIDTLRNILEFRWMEGGRMRHLEVQGFLFLDGIKG